MPTPLTKPVSRRDPRTNLVVTLAPEGVYVRKAGTRTTYGPLAFDALEVACARVQARAAMTERAAERASKGKRLTTPRTRVSRNLLTMG